MSKYLCADCVCNEQCNGEWTTHCVSYVPKEHKQTNEEWFCNLDTEDKAREISDMTAQGYWSEELVEKWLKEPHRESE